jgi:hypothetical protein
MNTDDSFVILSGAFCREGPMYSDGGGKAYPFFASLRVIALNILICVICLNPC